MIGQINASREYNPMSDAQIDEYLAKREIEKAREKANRTAAAQAKRNPLGLVAGDRVTMRGRSGVGTILKIHVVLDTYNGDYVSVSVQWENGGSGRNCEGGASRVKCGGLRRA